MMTDLVANTLAWRNEVCEVGVELSFVAGLTAGLLAIVVIAINVVARRWMTAAQMAALWGLVLLRMLIPFGPASPLSVQNSVVYADKLLSNTDSAGDVYASQSEWTRTAAHDSSQPVMAYSETTPLVAVPPVPPTLSDRVIEWLPFIWAAGMLFVLSNTLVRHWWFCRRVARSGSNSDRRLTGLCEQTAHELGMRRTPRTVVFDGVAQPAVMGCLRPQVLIPSSLTDLSDRQIRMVLLHELMHLKRFDTAANWLLLMIRACQWWNPVFWLASTRYLHLREQACDAAVLRRLNDDPSGQSVGIRDYSELLLTLAARVEGHGWRVIMPASLLGFVQGMFQKRAVSNRLRAIRRTLRPPIRLQTGIVTTLVAVVTAAGFTDAVEPQPALGKSSPHPWFPQRVAFRGDSAPVAIPSGEWNERHYNVTPVIQRIAADSRIVPDEAVHRCRNTLRLIAMIPPEANEPSGAEGDSARADTRTMSLTLAEENEGWQLVLIAPQSVHDVVHRSLRAWERGGLRQITIEARIATAKRELAQFAGIEWTSLLRASNRAATGSPIDLVNLHGETGKNAFVSATSIVEVTTPVLVSQISAEEHCRFVDAAQSDERSNVFFAPKVTVFNGQHAELHSLVQRAYVTAVAFADDGGRKPQIDVFDDGLRIMLQPQISADGAATNLVGRLALSNIDDVHTMTANLRGEIVAVQTPTVSSCRIDISAQVPHGESLLICLPPTHNRTEYTYVVLTPTPLPAGIGWSKSTVSPQ